MKEKYATLSEKWQAQQALLPESKDDESEEIIADAGKKLLLPQDSPLSRRAQRQRVTRSLMTSSPGSPQTGFHKGSSGHSPVLSPRTLLTTSTNGYGGLGSGQEHYSPSRSPLHPSSSERPTSPPVLRRLSSSLISPTRRMSRPISMQSIDGRPSSIHREDSIVTQQLEEVCVLRQFLNCC